MSPLCRENGENISKLIFTKNKLLDYNMIWRFLQIYFCDNLEFAISRNLRYNCNVKFKERGK